ncbi:hypothetical protein HaLaN_29106 [Haematococcus lacustris]|uniref:Uncharacterized protein n=1 Tax=Haematococcus lacustris TaxID=44745 RepID=A0A6A0ADW0_HAELA|nr:hypothetical protein HaLaN_29106 [Haematococcus lacustris]
MSADVLDALARVCIPVQHSVELLKRGQKGSLRTCGLGTVVLKDGADAAALMQLLDGKDIMGRASI